MYKRQPLYFFIDLSAKPSPNTSIRLDKPIKRARVVIWVKAFVLVRKPHDDLVRRNIADWQAALADFALFKEADVYKRQVSV